MKNVTARNRIVASPMCQYASDQGAPVDWHLAHLGRLGIGGAGIVFYEETAVEKRGRKTYRCAGIWSDDHIPAYRRIADFLRSLGATPAIQIGHSGQKGSVAGAEQDWRPLTWDDGGQGEVPWQPVAPSGATRSGCPYPAHELDVAEIAEVVGNFGAAARRANLAGFDILEVHGAHGYLIHQFLSPLTNRRTDAYGGTRQNRMRFAIEVVEAVRAAWPTDKPLFYRASCVDGKGGVWNLDDTIALSKALKVAGVDVIDCSSGGICGGTDMPVVARVPGYHRTFSRMIRAEADIPTMVVGLIDEAGFAEEILQSGDADLVAIGRGLLESGDWPHFAARDLGADPYGLLPAAYAHRLRRRDVVAAMDINRKSDLSAEMYRLIETT